MAHDTGVRRRGRVTRGRQPEVPLPGVGRRVVRVPRPPTPAEAPHNPRVGVEAVADLRPPVAGRAGRPPPTRRGHVARPDAVIVGVGARDAKGAALEVRDEGGRDGVRDAGGSGVVEVGAGASVPGARTVADVGQATRAATATADWSGRPGVSRGGITGPPVYSGSPSALGTTPHPVIFQPPNPGGLPRRQSLCPGPAIYPYPTRRPNPAPSPV